MRNRKSDLINFYQLLDSLSLKIGGQLLLSDCNSKIKLPSRGVYFFMEPTEMRIDTGSGLRVVIVGNHGLKLWSKSGGSHRGSIFRLLLGTTCTNKNLECSTWGQGSTAKGDVRISEKPLEQEVSKIIRNMPFLYLDIDDVPSPDSLRGVIERNSIALLSNFQKSPIDPPSQDWRGLRCNREKVRLSGLWNQNHVDEVYDPAFLQILETLINKMRPSL
jgi:hypothetical protein